MLIYGKKQKIIRFSLNFMVVNITVFLRKNYCFLSILPSKCKCLLYSMKGLLIVSFCFKRWSLLVSFKRLFHVFLMSCNAVAYWIFDKKYSKEKAFYHFYVWNLTQHEKCIQNQWKYLQKCIFFTEIHQK